MFVSLYLLNKPDPGEDLALIGLGFEYTVLNRTKLKAGLMAPLFFLLDLLYLSTVRVGMN